MFKNYNILRKLNWKYPIIVILILFVSSCSTIYIFNKHPYIKKGFLDLSSWKLHKPIQLMGEVEFYWEKFLLPSDFMNDSIIPENYIHIPGIWNDLEVNKKTLNGDGFATYRFIIKTSKEGIYGLKFNEVDCAYKVWANGVLDSVGKVSNHKSGMRPSWERKELFFNSKNHTIEVIIQVSNYHHRKGGLEDILIFGTGEQIAQLKQKSIGSDIFLLSIILVMGLTHLFIYFLRNKEKTALIFGVLCLVMLVRLISTSEKLILEFFPSIPWSLAVRLEYFSYTIVVPLMFAFLHSYYPQDFSKKILKIITFIATLFSITYFITPVKIFSYTPLYYQVIIVISGIYVLVALARAIRNKRENALIFLGGYIVFFIIVINDILYYNKVINSSLLLPLGLAVMVISQSFALTKRQIKALTDVEELTKELNRYNLELEAIVKDRTQKVMNQKEELETQAEKLKEINDRLVELSRFKDNLTGMAVHDMKNHLSNILHLSDPDLVSNSDFLEHNQLVYQSAIQLSNLVMNILDTQRFEEAKFDLALQNTSLCSMVESAIKNLSVLANQKRITINNYCKSDIILRVDSEIITRVFMNLISNAIKFSKVGSYIEIKFEKINEFIRFNIVDNGYGIPVEMQSKVFEKYVVLGSPQTTSLKSTGLGLPFCKLAIEAHGGQLGVTSNVDQGSTFWFTLLAQNYNEGSIQNIEKVEQKKGIELLKIDIDILLPLVQKLSTIKYYEVTAINKTLNELSVDQRSILSQAAINWLDDIKKASVYGDQQLYQNRIDEVIQNK